MSVWQCTPSAAPLCGSEGELVAVSISVSPRDLEALLEGLAHVDFPINPQIYHSGGDASRRRPHHHSRTPGRRRTRSAPAR